MEEKDREAKQGGCSVIRHHRERKYVQVDHGIINDTRLSWKAKGLMVYLLSRPDGWQFWENEIETHAKDGRISVAAGLKELEDCGYLTRTWLHADGSGRFKGRSWDVYEVSIKVAQTPEKDRLQIL